MIVSNVCKHPTTLADATKAYVEDTSLSVRFLIAEDERMAKELQTAKQGGEQVTTFAKAELKREILNEVSYLEIVMRMLYSRFGNVHKSVVHLNGWQQCCGRRACILSDLHTVVDRMKTWTMRYKGSPLHLLKLMKPKAVELKECISSQICNYEELPQLVSSL